MNIGPASDPLRVVRRHEGNAVVLRTTGEVDLNTAPVLADELNQAISAAKKLAMPVVADLSDVTFLGSSGLAVLLDARAKSVAEGAPLRVVATGRPVLRTIEIAGVQDLVPVYPTVADALAPGAS